jgi:probable rRNA maturation factor
MILNRQRQVRVSVAGLEKFLARAGRALRMPLDSFTVCLVTNAEIARWNRAYRGKPRPTDVLSFPSDESNGNRHAKSKNLLTKNQPAPYIGDIAIAPQVARRNAERFGRTFDDEMRILMLHGMLHLMGYDHETDTGQMDRRERRLRRQLGLL